MENQGMVRQYHFNIFIVYCIAILHCILLIYKCGIQWDYDTASYISAWENISSFHIDIWRTPVYPLFIGITKAFFETNFLMAASIIQHIVFLISMVPLIELRGAIPYAVGFDLPVVPSIIVALLGNMLPVPFIFLFARRFLVWGKDQKLIGGFCKWCLEKGGIYHAD